VPVIIIAEVILAVAVKLIGVDGGCAVAAVTIRDVMAALLTGGNVAVVLRGGSPVITGKLIGKDCGVNVAAVPTEGDVMAALLTGGNVSVPCNPVVTGKLIGAVGGCVI